MKLNALILAGFLILTTPGTAAFGQDLPPTERVLIPVLWQGAGYANSFWNSELLASNSGASSVIVAPGGPICAFELCDNTLAPGATGRWGSIPRETNYGVFFVVERSGAHNIHFGLRVWETSRSAENFGVTIPVIRESEWYSGTIELLHVPVGDNQRVSLRAYEYRPTDTLSVRVMIFPETGDELIGETTLDLRQGDILDEFYPFIPSYGMITDLLQQFPQLAGMDQVKVRLVPSAARQYWAFATVTNNVTQAVTVITPE